MSSNFIGNTVYPEFARSNTKKYQDRCLAVRPDFRTENKLEITLLFA